MVYILIPDSPDCNAGAEDRRSFPPQAVHLQDWQHRGPQSVGQHHPDHQDCRPRQEGCQHRSMHCNRAHWGPKMSSNSKDSFDENCPRVLNKAGLLFTKRKGGVVLEIHSKSFSKLRQNLGRVILGNAFHVEECSQVENIRQHLVAPLPLGLSSFSWKEDAQALAPVKLALFLAATSSKRETPLRNHRKSHLSGRSYLPKRGEKRRNPAKVKCFGSLASELAAVFRRWWAIPLLTHLHQRSMHEVFPLCLWLELANLALDVLICWSFSSKWIRNHGPEHAWNFWKCPQISPWCSEKCPLCPKVPDAARCTGPDVHWQEAQEPRKEMSSEWPQLDNRWKKPTKLASHCGNSSWVPRSFSAECHSKCLAKHLWCFLFSWLHGMGMTWVVEFFICQHLPLQSNLEVHTNQGVQMWFAKFRVNQPCFRLDCRETLGEVLNLANGSFLAATGKSLPRQVWLRLNIIEWADNWRECHGGALEEEMENYHDKLCWRDFMHILHAFAILKTELGDPFLNFQLTMNTRVANLHIGQNRQTRKEDTQVAQTTLDRGSMVGCVLKELRIVVCSDVVDCPCNLGLPCLQAMSQQMKPLAWQAARQKVS